MPLTPDRRLAQRKLVGTLNMKSSMWFKPGAGLCIWRNQHASEDWGAGIPEPSKHVDPLGVPYVARVGIVTIARRRKIDFTLVVDWDDLLTLARWMASSQKQIDRARGEIDRPTSH